MSDTPNAENNVSTQNEPSPSSTNKQRSEVNSPNIQRFMEMFFTQFSKMSEPGTSKAEQPLNNGDRISFNLAKYDPDESNYSMEEWLKDVNDIRTKLKIDDQIMILN